MSQTIKLPNFNTPNIKGDSVLTTDHVAGGYPQLTMENTAGFATPSSAYVGKLGDEQGEIVALGVAGSDTNVAINSGLKFDHPLNTPVYLLYGTDIKVYRAPNVSGLAPDILAFSLLDTVAIKADSLTTLYTDDDGGPDYWYRFTYSGPNGQTNLADSPAVRGGNVGIYCSVDEIRQAAGFENAKYITDQMIAPHRAAAQATIDGSLSGKFVVPFADPINPQIAAITKLLAAGYLLMDQYPSQPDRGEAKVKAANAELNKILQGEMTLLNVIGVDQQLPGGIDGGGFPDGDANYDANEVPAYFHMADVVNNYDRKY